MTANVAPHETATTKQNCLRINEYVPSAPFRAWCTFSPRSKEPFTCICFIVSVLVCRHSLTSWTKPSSVLETVCKKTLWQALANLMLSRGIRDRRLCSTLASAWTLLWDVRTWETRHQALFIWVISLFSSLEIYMCIQNHCKQRLSWDFIYHARLNFSLFSDFVEG